MVKTDQQNLKYLLEQRMVSLKYQKWLVKLIGYDFQIRYNPGKENKVADALSRLHVDVALQVLSIATVIDWDQIKEEVQRDANLKEIVAALIKDPSSTPNWTLENGLLCYKHRVVIPRWSALIPSILAEFHISPISGHGGFLRTYKRLTAELFGEGMKLDVKKFVSECHICQ